jgi:hypothetical protein
MAFEGQVLQLSEDSLDKLFDSAPAGSPNADSLIVGKENTTEVVGESGADEKIIATGTQFGSGLDKIPVYEEDDEEVDDKETGDTDETVEEGADADKAKAKPAKTKKNAAAPVEPKEGDAEENEDADEDEENDNKDADPQKAAINEALSNTVKYLIESGKWVDFEGREELEINDEVYAELAAKQDEYRLGKLFNELVDSTGEYGKAIISHVKNGGNPDEIIDLFKEQKQLQQMDTSTETGKQAVIEKYYKEILGWKPEKVTRTVTRLITDNEIDAEFADVKEMYDQHYQQQLQETQERTKQQELEKAQRQEVFVNSIKTVLQEDTSLTQEDRNLIQKSVFDFKHQLPNGQKVNDFYIKFAELQADPKEYVEFVRFVMDKENYKKSIKRAEKTTANKAAFSFIKGGSALSKTKNSQVQINENKDKAYRGTDFSFALKK